MDIVYGITFDNSSNVIIAGRSTNGYFSNPQPQDYRCSWGDVFVTKLNNNINQHLGGDLFGNVDFIYGSSYNSGSSCFVNTGNNYVCGSTNGYNAVVFKVRDDFTNPKAAIIGSNLMVTSSLEVHKAIIQLFHVLLRSIIIQAVITQDL